MPCGIAEKHGNPVLGSPIWNVRAPMIMSTFTEGLDFSGKTVFPLTTYAMSGLGTHRTRLRRLLSGVTLVMKDAGTTFPLARTSGHNLAACPATVVTPQGRSSSANRPCAGPPRR
ncbi:flavodoxin [Nonomuraea sp. NPDC046802]|uniref:flavodoxin n=1 Tax=Nonomuraea sp. NPDC046802 TaxID=3154919 RepID=UPI0033C46EF4